MSIRSRIQAAEARRAADAAHHEVERSYSRGWRPRAPESEFGDVIGLLIFCAAMLIGLAYVLPRLLEAIR